MMKKNKVLIIILFVVLSFSCIVIGGIIAFRNDIKQENKDDRDKLLLTCESDEIWLNEDVKCSLTGNFTSYEVSAISVKIKENRNYKISDVIVDSVWQGNGDDGLIVLYTDKNKNNKFNIATFTISLIDKNVDKINVALVDIILSDGNYDSHEMQNISKTLKVREE